MGYWKDFQEKIGGGVHEPYQLDYVCACCFGDSALKYCVEADAARKVCTFCDAQEDDLISAPFLDVIGYISECLAREYALPRTAYRTRVQRAGTKVRCGPLMSFSSINLN